MCSSIESLISSGHTLTEISTYTLKQVYWFNSLADKRKSVEYLNDLAAIRVGVNASEKGFTQFLEDLNRR